MEELLPNYHFDVDDVFITDVDFLNTINAFLKETIRLGNLPFDYSEE